MKTKLLPFILVLFCFACHRGKANKNSTTNKLTGKWSVIETVQFQNNDDSIATQCNVCPQIIFDANETGYLERAGQEKLDFSWQFDSLNLVIKHIGNPKDTDAVINNGTYQFTQNSKGITLTDTAKNIKYILDKP